MNCKSYFFISLDLTSSFSVFIIEFGTDFDFVIRFFRKIAFGGAFTLIPSSRYLIGSITWYSVLIMTGAALSIWFAVRQEKQNELPPDTIIDLALRIIPFGILGARIYYVFFSWEAFSGDFFSIFKIWEGGLAIYGGILSGMLVILFYCRKRNLSVLLIFDIIVPGLSLAQAIGRWGNYFNMEAYGWALKDGSALCFFPMAVLIPGSEGYVWHLATFFYESMSDFMIFLILLALRKYRSLPKGQLFCFYIFFYASVRLFIEELREDSLYTGSVRISQLLSFLAQLILLVILLYHICSIKKQVGFRAIPQRILMLMILTLLLIFPVSGVVSRLVSIPLWNLLVLFLFSSVSVSLYVTGSFFYLKYGRSSCQQPQ